MRRIAGLTLAVVLVASGAWAQAWKGTGRLSGKVVDEQGKPLEGVSVLATFPEVLGALLEAKSDKKGEWSVEDVAEGSWQLVFEKDGYDPGKGSAEVDETGRSAAVRTTLKKSFNPNEFIKAEAAKADALMGQKKYAEARAVYEGIIKRVPDVSGPMQQYVARTYYLEGKPDQAIESLKAGLAKDAGNLQMKLALVSLLCDTGALDEATQMAGTVDETKLTDPQMYLSFGLALVKKQKAVDALPYFDKAVAKFPQAPEGYYYRASALIELVNAEKDPKNADRIARIGKIKADLTKFLQLAPTAPEADQVRKLLEQIDKV
jgi:tetratricopeptide (TPR) repeat protein